MNIYQDTCDSPVGRIVIEASDKGITRVSRLAKPELISPVPNEHIAVAISQLHEYFQGKRTDFTVAIDTQGYSEFYQNVWNALRSIPYGQTRSYLEIAKTLGDTKSVRAVGLANGKNPIGIMIPCHRVIGSNGKLVGYAGGMDMKKWLLLHERSFSPKPAHLLF